MNLHLFLFIYKPYPYVVYFIFKNCFSGLVQIYNVGAHTPIYVCHNALMTTTQCDYALCSKCKSDIDSKKVSITNDKRQSRRKILGEENKRKTRYSVSKENTNCTEECKHSPKDLVCLFDGSYFSKDRIDSLKRYGTKYPFSCNECDVHFVDKGSKKRQKLYESSYPDHQSTLI